jgi:subtilisin family serine protease
MLLRLLVVFLAFVIWLSCSVSAQYQAAVDHPKARTDRIIVKFKPDAAPVGDQRPHGRVIRRFPALGVEVIQLDGTATVAQALSAYRADARVVYAQADHIRVKHAVPNDPGAEEGDSWHLFNDGRELGKARADISAQEAWSIRHDAENVVVAVLDTGIRHTHEDLAANMWTNAGELSGQLGVDDDGNGVVDDIYGANLINNTGAAMDDEGHGTFIAGLIGAVGNNGKGVTGVCWRVKLMAVKVLDAAGGGSDSDIIAGMEYARQNGAKIINASLGRVGAPSPAMNDAVTALQNSEVILVVAAGNSSSDNDFDPEVSSYPASVSHPNVVTVASSSRNDLLATFSNFGWRNVDIAAPGVQVPSTSSESDTAYDVESGTSISAPLVAGALALIKAHAPGSTTLEQIQRLLNSVDPVPALAGKVSSGGRLNVARALAGTAVAPINDAFVRAIDLGNDISFAGTGVTRAASTEPGERHTGNFQFPRRSLWFKWTAPFTGRIRVIPTPARDSISPPIVTVYGAGDSLGQLPFLATNAPFGGANTQPFFFEAVFGQTFFISLENGQNEGTDAGFYGIFDEAPDGYEGYTLLSVDSVGAGTIIPAKLLGDTIQKRSKTVTLRAKPAPGYILHSWVDPSKMGEEAILSRDPTYTFPLNGVAVKAVTAVFDFSPFRMLQGRYHGLVTADSTGAAEAFFILDLNSAGSFSATLRLGMKAYRFKGTLRSDREFTLSIPRPGDSPIEVQFELASERRITGKITAGSTFSLLAEAGDFDMRRNPTLSAGTYTVLLPVSSSLPNQPEGAGYGFVTVSPAGNLRFGGALGDGKKVSQGVGLYRIGHWPVFLSPYKAGGSLAGLVAFDESKATTDLTGSLDWSKAPSDREKIYGGGFSGVKIALEGSRYRAPVPGERLLALGPGPGNASIVLAGAGAFKTFSITIDGENRVAPTTDLNLAIFTSTGEFAANFRFDGEQQVSVFRGMVSQKANKGAGYFLRNGQSGKVDLQAD